MFYAMKAVFGALSGLWAFTWLTADKPVELKFEEAIGFLQTLAGKILSFAAYLQDINK